MKPLQYNLLSIFLLMCPLSLEAQTSEIKGQITVEETGQSISGVNVIITGIDSDIWRGSSTSAQGSYRITDLTAGTYQVRATAIGYIPVQKRVQLSAGETFSLSFRLKAKSYELGQIVVHGRPGSETTQSATVRYLPSAEISRQDPATVADVAEIIPGANVHTNSRGQTILYFRNSSDRQMAQFFEGALLNIPWDNRVDLGMLPAAMIGSVTASTGVPSVRYGANVIAGAVNFHPRTLEQPGQLTEIRGALGFPKKGRASIVYMRRKGNFNFTGSLDFAARGDMALPNNAFPLAETVYSQPSDETRVNTDRWIGSGFLHGAYQFDGGSQLSASFLHVEGEHGIAPESNLNPAETGIRYWRYPTWRKSMLIVSGAVPLGEEDNEGALLHGAAWFNRFEQTINQYTNVSYDQLGESQNNVDYTGGFRLIGELPTGPGILSLSVNALTTRHWQNILSYQGGTASPDSINIYRQHILNFGIEYDLALTDRLEVSAGVGLNGSLYVETGPFLERDPFWSWALTTGLSYNLSENFLLRAAAGRKTRFPTMRELFGSGLGKFVVNPGLGPITARMIEGGIERRGRRLSGGVTVFYQKTEGTISQRTIQSGPDAGKEQRINLGGSRTYGLELTTAVRVTKQFSFDGRLTWMNTRAVFKGETTKRNEKPSWLGQLTATYETLTGFTAMAQLEYLGGAYARTEQNVFVTLPSATIIDARLSYNFTSMGGEVFVRVNNLTDQVLLLQPGLPRAGRSFLGGLKFQF